MYFSMYDMYFMLPAIIVALWAQFKVKSTFSKYSTVKTINGKSGFEAARNILDQNGLQNIPIELVNGKLTDHYDPKAGVIRLSNEVYNGRSVSAIGVAAHEAGHAVQYAEQYTPIYIRSAIVPMTNICSYISYPLIIIGILLSSPLLARIGVILFAMVVLFQLVTLPVEFNASARAIRTLPSLGLNEEEITGSKRVLRAAAMTYVAALFTALMNFLRLLTYVNRNQKRR